MSIQSSVSLYICTFMMVHAVHKTRRKFDLRVIFSLSSFCFYAVSQFVFFSTLIRYSVAAMEIQLAAQ